MSTKQGAGSADVVTVKKVNVPNGWPNVRSQEELDQAGKIAGKYRNAAKLSNGVTVSFGSTSSTWRSKGSTGKADSDKTIRDLTVAGKLVHWQVYPLVEAVDQLRPYMSIIDLYQNFVRAGASTSGIMIDAVLITLSDPTMVNEVLTTLGGVSEAEFASFVALCESLRDYWQAVTGEVMPIGETVFNVTTSDGSTRPAAQGTPKVVTSADDLATLFS